MRVLSLFSGIGGFDLGLEWAGMTIVGQVEIDDYCNKILEYHWPNVPRWRDIRTTNINDIRERCGAIDLVCGGFPCQDISLAGTGLGLKGARSSLWWEMRRIISDLRPTWVLIENVPALRNRGGDDVLAALEQDSYSCWPCVVGGWTVGAEHRRNRAWIIGLRSDSDCARCHNVGINGLLNGEWAERRDNTDGRSGAGLQAETVGVGPNSNRARHEGMRCPRPRGFAKSPYSSEQWEWEEPRTYKSTVGSSIHGIPQGLAIRAIGNAVIPQVIEAWGRVIMKANARTA